MVSLVFRRRRRHPPVAPVEGMDEARAAVTASRRKLAASQRKTPEIRALGQLMRELRSENHFAERVAEMLSPPDEGNGHVHGG